MNNLEKLQASWVKIAVSEKTKGTITGGLTGGFTGSGLGAGAGAIPTLIKLLANPQSNKIDLSSIGIGALLGGGAGTLAGGLFGRRKGKEKDELNAAKTRAGIPLKQKLTPDQLKLLAILAAS